MITSLGVMEIFLCTLAAMRLNAAMLSPWLPVVMMTVRSSG